MQLCLFPSESPIPNEARPIPGLDEQYLITPDGEVWGLKWDGPRRMKPRPRRGGFYVCLWRFNQRWRPNISTLLRRTFGADKRPSRTADERLLAEVLDEYGDAPEVRAWAESI